MFDHWSYFDSFILIHYDCVKGMVTSFKQLFWKSKNHLFWCFLSQLQYRNENQNYISNFIFQFIKKKKRNGTLGTRIGLVRQKSKLKCLNTLTKNRITRSFFFFLNNTLFTKNNILLEIHPAGWTSSEILFLVNKVLFKKRMKLLVILFLVRLYARINMFKLIEEKYGRIGIK